MNTFLPHDDYDKSAKCLDDARLRKQQVETVQIIETLTGKSAGWANHPAVLMWKDNVSSLALYGVSIANECLNRGFSSHKEFFVDNIDSEYIAKFPLWLGDNRFHSSHRSRLLFKGRVDAVCYSLRSFLEVRSINEWLYTKGFPPKNQFTHEDIIKIEDIVAKMACPVKENHYKQFNWQEPDTLPYFWPTKNVDFMIK
jgi:hypothetical protein